MIWCVRDRNAEARRTQRFSPPISSALSASPRFKILCSAAEHSHVLTPGRTACAEEVEDDGVPFAEKMKGLTRELATQFSGAAFQIHDSSILTEL